MRRLVLLLGFVFLACYGFGGPEWVMAYPNFDALNNRLTAINDSFGGIDQVLHEQPLNFLGGHGAAHVGSVTVGGRGALGSSRAEGDAVTADLACATGAFEVGYPWAPVEYFWLRPCLELQAAGWVSLVRPSGSTWGDAAHRRWNVAWDLSVLPSLEAMARLRYLATHYIGVYASGGYNLPLFKPDYYGHRDPADFDLSGFVVRAGIRFGAMKERVFRF